MESVDSTDFTPIPRIQERISTALKISLILAIAASRSFEKRSKARVLVALYEEHDKPPIAIEFVRKALGGPTVAEFEHLTNEKNEIVAKFDALCVEHEEACRKLNELLPPPPPEVVEGGELPPEGSPPAADSTSPPTKVPPAPPAKPSGAAKTPAAPAKSEKSEKKEKSEKSTKSAKT